MEREATIRAINDKFREMLTETIMFHQVVADVLGLHILITSVWISFTGMGRCLQAGSAN